MAPSPPTPAAFHHRWAIQHFVTRVPVATGAVLLAVGKRHGMTPRLLDNSSWDVFARQVPDWALSSLRRA